jgi:integrase
MASVRKRKWTHRGVEKEAWVVTYADDRGKRHIKTFERKKDADKFRLEVESDIASGTHVAASDTLAVEAALTAWLRDCERRHKALGSPARSTIMGYEQLSKTIVLPRWGHELMTDITADDVSDWFIDMAASYSFDTLRQLRLILNQVIKFCIKNKSLKRNVIRDNDVRLPGEKQPIVIPSRDQIAQLLRSMERRANGEQVLTFLQRRVCVLLALLGGMRIGEICGLQWQYVRSDLGIIEIRHSYSAINGLKGPKTKAGVRDIPLPPVAFKALGELWDYLDQPEEGFVLQTKTGENMRLGYDAILWRPLMKKAGLMHPARKDKRFGRPMFHFHALRHAAVSMLLDAGVKPLAISPFVGHKNVTTTLGIYGHLIDDDETVKQALPAMAESFAIEYSPPAPVCQSGARRD